MCVWSTGVERQRLGVSLTKTTMGTSFPEEPSGHLLPSPGSLRVGRGVSGGAWPDRGARWVGTGRDGGVQFFLEPSRLSQGVF